MRAQVTLQPGQKGTKSLVEQYGSRLICVRYRCDEARQRHVKTVEIIVEEAVWTPSPLAVAADAIVGVGVATPRQGCQWKVEPRAQAVGDAM